MGRRITRKPISQAQWRREHRSGVPHKVLRNPDLRGLVDSSLDTRTFREIAAACRERFGDAAPSHEAVRRYWISFFKTAQAGTSKPILQTQWRREHRSGVPHKVLRNPDLKALVDSLLATRTFREIAAVCRERFGDAAPSHVAIRRYWLSFLKVNRGR